LIRDSIRTQMADSQVPIQHDSLQTTLLCIYFLNFSSSSGLCLPRVIIIIINIIIMAILKCNASRITSHHSSVAETSADKKNTSGLHWSRDVTSEQRMRPKTETVDGRQTSVFVSRIVRGLSYGFD